MFFSKLFPDGDAVNAKLYCSMQHSKGGLNWTMRSCQYHTVVWFGRSKLQMEVQFTSNLKCSTTPKACLSLSSVYCHVKLVLWGIDVIQVKDTDCLTVS